MNILFLVRAGLPTPQRYRVLAVGRGFSPAAAGVNDGSTGED